MAVKVNPYYKPDEDEVMMFFRDQEKNGMVSDYCGYGALLKMEYPTLTDKEIIKFLIAWKNKNKKN